METRKNLCAMLPVALHTRVRQEQEKAGMTLGEYVEAMITEYYDWKDGKIMTGEMRTLAAQIPAAYISRSDLLTPSNKKFDRLSNSASADTNSCLPLSVICMTFIRLSFAVFERVINP